MADKELLQVARVLFGCGNGALLSKGGIAVVGSRDADEDDLRFPTSLARTAAHQGLSVVSGAARGVDERAMLDTLESEGTAVGVVADSLLRAATSAKYRKHLLAGDLVLVSPFNPEAGFNVGNAMARNRYIYCLSDAAVVVNSTPDKGGTWNGAIENLKSEWVPLWVKPKDNPNSGNAALVQKGARWFPEQMPALSRLWETMPVDDTLEVPSSLLPFQEEVTAAPAEVIEREAASSPSIADMPAETPTNVSAAVGAGAHDESLEPAADFYNLFLIRILQIKATDP